MSGMKWAGPMPIWGFARVLGGLNWIRPVRPVSALADASRRDFGTILLTPAKLSEKIRGATLSPAPRVLSGERRPGARRPKSCRRL